MFMETVMNPTKPILITGGNGKTGRRVAETLAKMGVPTRLSSRSTTPAFDWNDESTWQGAVEGTSAIYLVYQPDLCVPGAKEAIAKLAGLALEAGAGRIVLLSGRGEVEARASEQALIDSGADWTIIRSAWFNQNFSEGMFMDMVMAGEVALPVSGVREPFIDTDDIADIAVKALTEDGHVGRLYEVTGPRLLTFAEAVGEIAQASGRDVSFRTISHEDFIAGAESMGLPKDILWLLDMLFTETLDGRNESLTDGVQQALGRAPKDFSHYVRAAAGSGVWNG